MKGHIMSFSKTLEGKKLIIQCDACFREITLDLFIKCSECAWDQCFACFFENIETEEHKSTHNYRMVNNLSKPLLNENWRVIDELLLLHGIISFGIGNFEDITSILFPKTQEEVKKHFFMLVGITDNQEGEILRHIIPKSDPNDPVVLSYMPKRQDFESEILNDYEMLICNLQFYESDTLEECRFKDYMLYYYSMLLRQRRMWKTYVLDRNFIEVNKIKEKETPNTLPIINKFKWVAQYISKNDFNYFISHILKEQKLKGLINSRKIPEYSIDEEKLSDVSFLLGKTEKELCKRLNMSRLLYADLKGLAIDCYVSKKSLKQALAGLFDESEKERVEILYGWFKDQKIVHCDSQSS